MNRAVTLCVASVLALGLVLVLGWRLLADGAGDGERPADPAAEVLDALTAPVCPAVFEQEQQGAAYSPVDGDDPAVDGELAPASSGRAYCLTSFFWEQPRGWRITAYTVRLRSDGANYGQSYTTSDAEGSEELLNFPFTTQVYGRCARATGEVVMTDRRGGEHRYTAALDVGPRCGGAG